MVVVKEKPGPDNESWEQHGWSALNVAKTEPGRIYVNMDSADLKNYLVQCQKRLRNLAEILYKIGIYINAIILNLELDQLQSTDKDKIFNIAINSFSKTLLPLYMDQQIQKLDEKE